MASAQVPHTSVANNSPCQDSSHPHDHFQERYVTLWLKPVSSNSIRASGSFICCLGTRYFFAFFSRLAYASVVIMTSGFPAGHLSSCRSAKVDIVFFILRSFLFLRSTSSPTTFSSTLIKPCYNLLRKDRLKERRMERQKSAKERRKALESKMARWKNSDQLEHSQGRD